MLLCFLSPLVVVARSFPILRLGEGLVLSATASYAGNSDCCSLTPIRPSRRSTSTLLLPGRLALPCSHKPPDRLDLRHLAGVALRPLAIPTRRQPWVSGLLRGRGGFLQSLQLTAVRTRKVDSAAESGPPAEAGITGPGRFRRSSAIQNLAGNILQGVDSAG